DKVAGGDVKYHLGYSNDRAYPSGRVHLSLSFNPSHLEWVGPVVQGRVRAKQDRNGGTRGICLPLIVHGDAAFAGQGIVDEAFNMSELEGYSVGGTVHVVLNNQVGFTTSPGEAYSSTYPTDVARMLQVPIFHVNGEDPESVAQVVELAVDFRQQFHRDALIDLWCYRKYGHNEGDEPSFTQPVMYRKIAQKASIRAEYVERLSQAKGLTLADADALAGKKRDALEKRLAIAASFKSAPAPSQLAGARARHNGRARGAPPAPPPPGRPPRRAPAEPPLPPVPARPTPRP